MIIPSLHVDDRNLTILYERLTAQSEFECTRLINILSTELAPYLGEIAVLCSGSLFTKRFDDGSDVDLVVLLSKDSSKEKIRLIIEQVLHANELYFYDISFCIQTPTGWHYSKDVIDRRMVFKTSFLFGSTQLWNSFHKQKSFTRTDLIKLICFNTLFRFAPIPPGKEVGDLKYCVGGLRDLTRIWDILFFLENHFSDSLTEYKKCIEQVRRFENRAWYLLKYEFRRDICISVDELYSEIERWIFEVFAHDLLSDFVELRQLYRSGRVLHVHPSNFAANLRPLALALYHDLIRLRDSEVSIGEYYTAILHNRHLTDEQLQFLVHITGFEWRNIQDQLLKHPNISEQTVRLILQSANLQTADRVNRKLLQLNKGRQWSFLPPYIYEVCPDTEEELPVVSQNGVIDGTLRLFSEVHQRGLIHYTVDILCLTPRNTFLLQQRTPNAYLFPNALGLSAGGHITLGQNVKAAAIAELREELNVEIYDETQFVSLNRHNEPYPLFYEILQYGSENQSFMFHRFHSEQHFVSLSRHYPAYLNKIESTYDGLMLQNHICNQELTYYFLCFLTDENMEQLLINRSELQGLKEVSLTQLLDSVNDPANQTDTFHVLQKYKILQNLEQIIRERHVSHTE